MGLKIEPYDEATDTVVIEGTRYAGLLFRELGCSFPNMVGQVLRIDKKENGVVTFTTMGAPAEPNAGIERQPRP